MEETNQQQPEIYGKPAGFWVRVTAGIIDSIILIIIYFLFVGVLVGLLSLVLPLSKNSISIILPVINIGIAAGYFIIMHGKYGQTLGKKVVGIKVIHIENDNTVSYLRAFGRFLSSFVAMIPIGIGYLMVAFTEKKRGLHDYIAGTRVMYIKKTSSVPVIIAIGAAAFFFGVVILSVLAAIVIPKISPVIREAATKGRLESFRSAIATYYADEGEFPSSIDQLAGKYLPDLTKQTVAIGKNWPGENSNSWKIDPPPLTGITAEDIDNMTAWMYNPYSGDIVVNSNEVDSKGVVWHTY